MNLITLCIIAVIVLLAALDVKYLLEHGDTCGGSCSACHGTCKWGRDLQKAKRSIDRKKKIRRFLHLDKA